MLKNLEDLFILYRRNYKKKIVNNIDNGYAENRRA
jgi:hypothetical protein